MPDCWGTRVVGIVGIVEHEVPTLGPRNTRRVDVCHCGPAQSFQVGAVNVCFVHLATATFSDKADECYFQSVRRYGELVNTVAGFGGTEDLQGFRVRRVPRIERPARV